MRSHLSICITLSVTNKKSKANSSKNSKTNETTDTLLDCEMDDEIKKTRKPRGKITPYKAKDLVPIVRSGIASNPSLSNKTMEKLLAPYGKTGKDVTVFTDNLLQNTRKLARQEVFGDPATNATYAIALKCDLEKRGHDVYLGLLDRSATLKKIYNVIWEEYKDLNPSSGESKKDFCHRWCNEHADELYLSLGDVEDHYSFVTEFFFSPSTARATAPKLQRVFQADAAHTGFGKYTLFSFYGTTANGTMFPIGLGLVFGNETKLSWSAFCKFVSKLHPTLNKPDVTIITDRCKGSIAAIDEYFPNAFQFHCSYHRAANILLNCKGGSAKLSPRWLFQTLVNCGSMESLNYMRDKYGKNLTASQLKYLNSPTDESQYPAARCAMGENIFLYDHEASSGVESMNKANKPARDRAAVDVVNAMILLVQMER